MFVEKIADQMYLQYDHLKGIAIMSPRDAFIVIMFKQTASGDYYLLYYSIEREDIYPKSKVFVRTNIPIGGWFIEGRPGPDGALQSYCTFLTEFDIGGNVPQWIIS